MMHDPDDDEIYDLEDGRATIPPISFGESFSFKVFSFMM